MAGRQQPIGTIGAGSKLLANLYSSFLSASFVPIPQNFYPDSECYDTSVVSGKKHSSVSEHGLCALVSTETLRGSWSLFSEILQKLKHLAPVAKPTEEVDDELECAKRKLHASGVELTPPAKRRQSQTTGSRPS